MCIYLTLPYLTYIQTPRTPKYRDEGREETFQQNCLLCKGTISFSEASLSLFMDEKHVQYVHNKENVSASYNVIFYAGMCDVLVVYRQGGFLTCGHVRI